jgi:hypothetical protein
LTPLPVLFILAVLWAVVLLPPLLRSRSQHTADSIVDFNYKLDVLGRTNGNLDDAGVVDPGVPSADPGILGARMQPNPLPTALRASAAQRSALRRRDMLRAFTMSVAATLLLAAVTHAAAAWALQILVDVIVASYLALWAWLRTLQVERTEKVRYMPERRAPELALRRSASS